MYGKVQLAETLSFRVSKPHAVWHWEWWACWILSGSFRSLVIVATCKARCCYSCECPSRPLLFFIGVEQKPHVQTKLDNLLVLQSWTKYRNSCVSLSLSNNHAWIFLSQVSTPVWLLILLKMMLCSTTLSRVWQNTGEKNTEKGELFTVTWFISAQAGGTLFSFFSGRYLPLLEIYSTRKLTDKNTSLGSIPTFWADDTTECIPILLWTWFWWDRICICLWGTFCVYRVLFMCRRYSAEQRHVSQLRGDTSDLAFDDKEVTIFRTSSAGSRRRIRR